MGGDEKGADEEKKGRMKRNKWGMKRNEGMKKVFFFVFLNLEMWFGFYVLRMICMYYTIVMIPIDRRFLKRLCFSCWFFFMNLTKKREKWLLVRNGCRLTKSIDFVQFRCCGSLFFVL